VAARLYDRLRQRQPDNAWFHYAACACSLATGDRERLRPHTEALLQLRRASPSLYHVDWAVKSCLLLPGTLADPMPVYRLADRLEKADPNDGTRPWYFVTRGIAMYRERPDQPAEAGRWLEKARAVPGRPTTCDTLAELFLAMMCGKQGRKEEARKLLAEARKTFEHMQKAPQNHSWLDRIHCRTALEEATKTVGAP
jgi:hypothetical protein